MLLVVSNKNALLAFELLITIWNQILSSVISDEEINLAKKKLISSFLMGNQFLDEILQRKIQLISYGLSPNYEENYISKLKDITPENILGLTKKHFAKSFLSITGDKKICCSIYNKWIKDS